MLRPKATGEFYSFALMVVIPLKMLRRWKPSTTIQRNKKKQISESSESSTLILMVHNKEESTRFCHSAYLRCSRFITSNPQTISTRNHIGKIIFPSIDDFEIKCSDFTLNGRNFLTNSNYDTHSILACGNGKRPDDMTLNTMEKG